MGKKKTTGKFSDELFLQEKTNQNIGNTFKKSNQSLRFFKTDTSILEYNSFLNSI